MKGRTNISGGGMNINADTENFTVASGSNVTAGNFVQYKYEKNDKKYDTNTGFGKSFSDSGNEAPKVLPCGNNKYVRRYKNNGETNVFWFNLIDVSNGFRVLSSFSISSTNLPSFCLLDDGNVAICYMTQENVFTIRIYSIENTFLMLNTFNIENENIGAVGATHITQIGNSKIIATKMNECIIADYFQGEITANYYINLGLSTKIGGQSSVEDVQLGDNDWNLYAVGNDSFLIFPLFQRNSDFKGCIFLIKITGDSVEILNEIENYNINSHGYLNRALWGNAFGINGKVLFSIGGAYSSSSDIAYINTYEYYSTKIYYKQNEYIAQTSNNNLFETAINAFGDLKVEGKDLLPNMNSSGTAQYVKENVFYVAVQPSLEYSKGINQGFEYINSNSRTAIYRVEYDNNSGMFNASNIVTFEGDTNAYKFGFGQFFENESGDVYYLYETQSSSAYSKTGRWLMRLEYKNGTLQIGEDSGMVENYTGSGAAIGVAKQSGKAGDVIEVYTPKP